MHACYAVRYASTKDVANDARKGARGEELGTRGDSRVAAAATTDRVSSTPVENGQRPEDCCVCVLRGLDGPDGPSRELLSSPTPSAVLRRRPRQSGNRPTLPGMQLSLIHI